METTFRVRRIRDDPSLLALSFSQDQEMTEGAADQVGGHEIFGIR
jgi:hypothetical protein